MTDETWVPVKGFPSYRVSNKGRVLNFDSGRSVKPRADKFGLLHIKLYSDGISFGMMLHRLVAEHFLVGYNAEKRVGFIDENKLNCCVENLKMETQGVRTASIRRPR